MPGTSGRVLEGGKRRTPGREDYYWNSPAAGLSPLLLSLCAPLDGLLAPVNSAALSTI